MKGTGWNRKLAAPICICESASHMFFVYFSRSNKGDAESIRRQPDLPLALFICKSRKRNAPLVCPGLWTPCCSDFSLKAVTISPQLRQKRALERTADRRTWAGHEFSIGMMWFRNRTRAAHKVSWSNQFVENEAQSISGDCYCTKKSAHRAKEFFSSGRIGFDHGYLLDHLYIQEGK